MGITSIIKNMGSALRGGSSFWQIFMGAFIGFTMGMIPGINLTFVILLLLLIIINNNGVIASLCFSVGKVMCILLAPITFNIGYVLVHNLGFAGVVRIFSDTPILAFLNFHIYSLLGGLIVAFTIGLVGSYFFAKSIVRARENVQKARGKSAKLDKINKNKFINFILNIAFGKVGANIRKSTGFFYKGRIVIAAILICVIAILQFMFIDVVAKQAIEFAISSSTGNEVNIDGVKVSLAEGKIEITNLQVVDSKNSSNNKIQADKIVADISVSDLLAKRFVLDSVVAGGMKMDEPKNRAVKVDTKEKSKKEEGNLLSSLSSSLGKFDVKKVADYASMAKEIKNFLSKLSKLQQSKDPSATENDDIKKQLLEDAKNKGYLRLSAKDYITKHPTWTIKNLSIMPLRITDNFGLNLQINNISSHPSLHKELMAFSVVPAGTSTKKVQDSIGGALKSLF